MGSTSARLTIHFGLIGAVTMAVFGVGLYAWVRQGLEEALERELAVKSALFRDQFLLASPSPGGVSPEGVLDLERFLETTGALAEVSAPDGARIFRSRAYQDSKQGYRTTELRMTGAGRDELRLRFALEEGAVREPLRQLRIYLAFFYPLGLALSSVVGFFFARQALSPVEELRRHAEQISRANLSERVPLPTVPGELRNLACTLNEMFDRVETAVEDLRHMAADAAHELRTPLANLRAEVETAIQEPRSADRDERVLVSVCEEVARMTRIVSDLFTLAQLDRRAHALERRRVEIRPLLEEARETWEAAARERRIEIRLEGTGVPVQGDPAVLSRVFMNLVENAVKYNKDGGQITLSVERSNGTALVRVADTGPGIDPEHLPNLFRRFYRVDPGRSREGGGAGLGLAIVKSFVEALGGTVSVQSVVREGTTFTLEFPALPEGTSRA